MTKSKHKKNMSDKQLEANRNNAQFSTGPGDTSQTRYNRTLYGFRGQRILIEGERQEDYDTLHDNMKDDLKPQGFYESYLVQRITDRIWEIERAASLKAKITDSKNAFRDEQETELVKLTQYEHRLEKCMMRLHKDLTRVKSQRHIIDELRPLEEEPVPEEKASIEAPEFPFALTQGEAACESLTRMAKIRILRGQTIIDPLGHYIITRADEQLAINPEHPYGRPKDDTDRS